MKTKNHQDVIIIGGGISGLLCATKINNRLKTTILDKGRNFGGRLATREFNGAIFDHGAQYFTAKSSRFQNYVNKWHKEKIIKVWFSSQSNAFSHNHPRWISNNGMNQLAKHIANNLNVIRSTEISKIIYNKNFWSLESLTGSTFSADNIVITIPVPQIKKLFSNSESQTINFKEINDYFSVEYEKGLAILAVLNGKSGIKKPGFLKPDNENISWIADNYIKGISPIPALTIHTSPEYSEKVFNKPPLEQIEEIINPLKTIIDSDIIDYYVHKWGYTTPIINNNVNNDFFEEFNLFFAGDSFSGPRVESAALSGLSIADKIINKYQN